MCPINRTHAAICLLQPRRRVWVTEWMTHLWFASGGARFSTRLLSKTLILQELVCFLCIKGQGLSLSFGDVIFSLLFYFWSYKNRQAQLFSAVLSPVTGISGPNFSRPQHHYSTFVVTADDWERMSLLVQMLSWRKSEELALLRYCTFWIKQKKKTKKKAPETLDLEHLITPHCHFCIILGMINQAADLERAIQF